MIRSFWERFWITIILALGDKDDASEKVGDGISTRLRWVKHSPFLVVEGTFHSAVEIKVKVRAKIP